MAQTRNQIIEKLFTGKNFNDCLGKMEPDHLREDLKMEVITIVCEWEEEKVLKLHADGKLEFYVVRVILNQIKSNSSPFAKKYRRVFQPITSIEGAVVRWDTGVMPAEKRNTSFFEKKEYELQVTEKHEQDIEEQRESLRQQIMEEVNNMRGSDDKWYAGELLMLYAELGNYRAIEAKTKIPFESCYKTIKKSFEEIKQKLMS